MEDVLGMAQSYPMGSFLPQITELKVKYLQDPWPDDHQTWLLYVIIIQGVSHGVIDPLQNIPSHFYQVLFPANYGNTS